MIKYLKKDITTVEKGIIAQGVNCKLKMGSGVAKAIKNKWSCVYDTFINSPHGYKMLGNVVYVPISENLFVANCYTQNNYGSDGKKYANVDAISTCLHNVFTVAEDKTLNVYMPRIGCGLGGLSWEYDVEPIIMFYDRIFKLNIYICDWEG